MRPRKVILLVDADEQALAVRKFMLETRGYRVIAVASPYAALELLETAMPGSFDLLLAELLLDGMDGNDLARAAKRLQPSMPVLLTSRIVTDYGRALAADAWLPKGADSPAELLGRVRVLVTRKRGPKKQVVSVTAQERAA